MVDSPVRSRRERAAELTERASANGGLFLLVDGASGMGKTHLLHDIARRATDARRVHYVAADAFEQSIPYAFIERILSAGVTEDSAISPGAETIEVARRLIDALVHIPRGEIRTLLLDDAQWIDQESARVLRFAIPRVVRRGVFLALAMRDVEEEGPLGAALRDYARAGRTHEHVTLEPLSAEDIRVLALDRFGTGISSRTAARLRDATGGSFLGLDHLFTGVTPSEIKSLHLTWNLPIRGASLPESPFLSGYATLSEAGRLAVEIASLAEQEIPRRALTRVAEELGEQVDIDEAWHAGVLAESGFGATVAVTHSLVASSVRDALSADRTRLIHRALADVTEGYPSITYALRGAEGWDDRLERRVDDYVAEAMEQGHLDATYEILRASIALATGATRERLVTDLALLNLRNKTGFAVLDLFDDIAALPENPVRDCLLIVLLVYRFEQEAAQARLRDLLMRPAENADTATIQAFLAFMSLILVMRSPDQAIPDELVGLCRQLWANAPDDPSQLADQRLGWMVGPRAYEAILDGYGIVALHLEYRIAEVAEVLPALVERALALPESDLAIDALVPLAGAAVAVGDVRLAQKLASTGVGMLSRVTIPPWAAGTIRLIRAHTLVLLGRLREAAEDVEQARELSYDVLDVETRMTFAALQAWIDAITGAAGAAAPLEESRRLGELGWEVYASDIVVIAECELARAAGEPRGVLAATAEERTKGLRNTQRGFLTQRAHALIDLDRLPEAEDLIDRLAAGRGTLWQETSGTLSWLRARLHRAGGDVERADAEYRAAAAESESLSPLVAALTAADHGAFLHEQGSDTEAEQKLRLAIGRLELIGADAYLPMVQDRLSAITDRDRREREKLVRSLTPREHEVARRLAAGLTNAQIAEALFVSQATARFHVSNVLRKLGITRRGEVATAIGEAR